MYQGDWVTVTVSDRGGAQVIWIGIEKTPSIEQVTHLSTILSTYATHSESKLVLHIEHVAGVPRLRTPNMEEILHIVMHLMRAHAIIEEKVLGTIVKARFLDDDMLLAKNVFLNFYTPLRPFDVVVDAQEVQTFLEGIFSKI